MNLPITSYIYSVEDRAYMLDKLSRLEQGSFLVKKSFEEQVHEEFSFAVAESLLQSAAESKIVLTDATSIQKFLKDVQASLRALPVVTLRVAFLPSNDLLRNISIWFNRSFGEKKLIGFVVDSTLVGGVAIELDGKYMDYSLKKNLEEKLNNKNSA